MTDAAVTGIAKPEKRKENKRFDRRWKLINALVIMGKSCLNELPRSRAAKYQNEFLSYLTPMQSIEEFFSLNRVVILFSADKQQGEKLNSGIECAQN